MGDWLWRSMAKRKDKLSAWRQSAGPMAEQASNDCLVAQALGSRVDQEPNFACTAIALLAQAVEKMLKAWLLSYQFGPGLNAVDWFEHNVLRQLDRNVALHRFRTNLLKMLGDKVYGDAGRLLKLMPHAGWEKNVEYPFFVGPTVKAPCESFGFWDYATYLKVAKNVTEQLKKLLT